MSLELLNQSATTFSAANVLHRQVGSNLIERLQPITLKPKRILDLGCGTGELITELHTLYPEAKIVGLDFAAERLAIAAEQHPDVQFECAPFYDAPFEPRSFDLIVSNLVLHWSDALAEDLKSIFRLLNIEGVFIFSFYGPDTFKNAGKSLGNFYDMHDVGDALVRAQFNDPVLDIERFTLDYDDQANIVQDLTDNGELALVDLVDSGLTELHYEVVYGHAWKLTEPMTSKIDQDGMVRISPAQILRKT